MPFSTAHQQLAAEIERLRLELLEYLEKCKENLLAKRDPETQLEDMQAALSDLSTYAAQQGRKLAAFVESMVRGAIAGKYSQEWTKARRIDSVRGVVEYVGDMTGEQENWRTRAESNIIDLLLSQVNPSTGNQLLFMPSH